MTYALIHSISTYSESPRIDMIDSDPVKMRPTETINIFTSSNLYIKNFARRYVEKVAGTILAKETNAIKITIHNGFLNPHMFSEDSDSSPYFFVEYTMTPLLVHGDGSVQECPDYKTRISESIRLVNTTDLDEVFDTLPVYEGNNINKLFSKIAKCQT